MNSEKSQVEGSPAFEKAREHFASGLEHSLHERWIEAEMELRLSLAYFPSRVSTLTNLSAVLIKLERLEEARTLLEQVLILDPTHCESELNRGILLSKKRKYEEALTSYDRAIELNPNYAEAWLNRGVALSNLRRLGEAVSSYDRAIELSPNFAEAWSNRGVALSDLGRQAEAIKSHGRAIEIKPNAPCAPGALALARMKICEWVDFDLHLERLRRGLTAGQLVSDPFTALGLLADPFLQKQCAERFAKQTFGSVSQLGPIAYRSRGNRIRLGYFSMDFREHPVAHLIAELIETHDRERFQVFGFSYGVNTDDTLRKRLERAFDKFIEVRNLSDLDIARLARENAIDVAIDLGGYTQESRPGIFVHRAAPVQINYLGYPGTTGATSIDYLIADPVLIPEHLQGAYSEKIIYLPNSYQANDSRRKICDRTPTRKEFGLPEVAFVFCCFNSNWKITPLIFNDWCRILKLAPNAVLWLYEDNSLAKQNLREEAKIRGIEPNRLIFAKHLPHSEHLARYQLADLFLDTFPYGAHTTASDALWTGLPVLTRTGEAFASRVAASLLRSVGLSDLVAQTTGSYISVAVNLAGNLKAAAAYKANLIANKTSCALFNVTLFTKHIEEGYLAAHKRRCAGLSPANIHISTSE